MPWCRGADEGPWVHLWSGNVINTAGSGLSAQGRHVSVPAGVGFPPVLFRADSVHGADLRVFVVTMGYCEGYSWNYTEEAISASSSSSPAISTWLLIVLILFGSAAVTFGVYKVKMSHSSSSYYSVTSKEYVKLNPQSKTDED